MKLQSLMFSNSAYINFSATKKVLYVEDDNGVSALYSRMIQEAPNQGDSVELTLKDNFKDAVSELETNTFDALITDGDVSTKGDGLIIIDKALEKGMPASKIAMLSANQGLESQVKAKKAAFILKSFDGFGVIADFIKNLFGN